MTDSQTDGQTDARGKTICLPTLKGGDIKTTNNCVSDTIITNGGPREQLFPKRWPDKRYIHTQ